MNHDRVIRFEVGGETRHLCFTQRALRALQAKHGMRTVSDVNKAIVEPIGLEAVLYEGLEGFRAVSNPGAPPVEPSEAEKILNTLPFTDVVHLVDRALVLAYSGPSRKREEEEDAEGGKAQATGEAARG